MRTPKRIILMRHAKSSWKDPQASDHERPLNRRGRRAAPAVGAELAARGWVPEQVITSDSARTTETFERMAPAMGFEGDVSRTPDLYLAGVDEIRAAASALPPSVRTVLILGHNPGWEQAVQWLSGADVVMKTGCAALLTRDAEDWPSALSGRGAWTLLDVIHPRDL